MSENNIERLDSTNWKRYVDIISECQESLSNGYLLGEAVKIVSEAMKHYSIAPSDKFNDFKDSYQLMCDFMAKGYEDKHRQELYNQLKRRLYMIISDLALEARLKYDPDAAYLVAKGGIVSLDIDNLRERLEAFVSDSAMLSLESESEKSQHGKELYENRQKFIADSFIGILKSGQWSRELAGDMAELLLSPTIDTIDAQVLCSAIMMAALLSPDPYKILSLAKIYKDATDQSIRQRALVGWTFASVGGNYSLFKDLQTFIEELFKDETVRQEIAELQIQVIYCSDAERDTETIRKDMMPTIMKNQNLEVTRYGIREKEDDPMEDVLHGDEMEKRMEEMEKTVNKMADMQKRGVDIYFGGFSKMKRFGFFYTLCNWFMPFYTQHPGLSHLSSKMLDSGFMQTLFSSGPFCDSDKYSFALGMSSVYEKLPANIQEMLSNETTLHIMGDSGANVHTPSFIRRFYLQDLYRFFRIYDGRKIFKDPFYDGEKRRVFLFNELFNHSKNLHDVAQSIIHFFMKRKEYSYAERLLEMYGSEGDIKDIITSARLQMVEKNNSSEAEELYEKALSLDSSDKAAIKGAALASFNCGHYDKAIAHYQKLSEIYPDKTVYRLNMAISQINGGKAEDGVNTLYELYYKYPKDMDVKRALAWGLLWVNKVEQSSKLYDDILASDTKASVDCLNAGYCAWFGGNVERAVELFREYARSVKIKVRSNKNNLPTSYFIQRVLQKRFTEDSKILNKYNIPDINREIVAGMI